MNLFEIKLPAGDVGGIDIDYKGDNATKLFSADWLSKGYDGVRIIGHASGTRIRAKDGYHNSTLFVGPHNGIVQLENLKLHVAKAKACHMGLALQPLYPKFCARWRGVEVVAEGPAPDGGREVWGLFTYQCDQDLQDVTFDTQEIAEHASYAHGGWASKGAKWVRTTVNGSGSQGFKARFAANEGQWVKGAKIDIQDCTFKGFGQPWGWRGGGGIVVEGGGSDILVSRSGFYGRPGSFRCLMVDDGAGAYVKPGPANGFVIVDACGFYGGPGGPSYDPVLRVGSTAQNPTWNTAKGVLIQNSAVYGERVLAQLSQIPSGKLRVQGCNTPKLKEIAHAKGFDTTHEAQLVGPKGTFVPFSVGVTG
jgi:hypothetical protein